MAIELLSKEQCPFCWQVKIAMDYLNIDYQLTEWANPDKALLSKYSPQATSPILLDDEPIWDSSAIIYYLEDLAVDKTLFPGTKSERNKARLLTTFSNSIVGKDLREVIFEKRSKPEPEWDIARIEKGDAGWRKSLNWLEEKIESKKSFLAVSYSIADFALLPRFSLAEHFGVAVDDRHPRLYAWYNNFKTSDLYMNNLPWKETSI